MDFGESVVRGRELERMWGTCQDVMYERIKGKFKNVLKEAILYIICFVYSFKVWSEHCFIEKLEN